MSRTVEMLGHPLRNHDADVTLVPTSVAGVAIQGVSRVRPAGTYREEPPARGVCADYTRSASRHAATQDEPSC